MGQECRLHFGAPLQILEVWDKVLTLSFNIELFIDVEQASRIFSPSYQFCGYALKKKANSFIVLNSAHSEWKE